MKALLRQLFSPILAIFEKGDGPYMYKPSSRKILIIMGLLFAAIATFIIYYIVQHSLYGYSLPGIVFSGVAFVCLVVGCLGSERAVAKIWGNK